MPYVPKASGFVLVRSSGDRLEYLILECRKWSHADFPKGHVDGAETELETARRETAEETGLTDLLRVPGFVRRIGYPVERGGRPYDKEVAYFLAWAPDARVRLSDEHTDYGWYGLKEGLGRLAYESTRGVLRAAAFHLKDAALFDLDPTVEAEAAAHLAALPEARPVLLGHLEGAARLARAFAEALSRAGVAIHVEATAAGALLHDVGRALGRHRDHQIAGVDHLRTSDLAPYAFACISHFTKGARRPELLGAGIEPATVDAFEARIDLRTMTWEERCVALADSCMDLDQPATPTERFLGLRRRYDADAFIAMQERRTERICDEIQAAIGADPLTLVGLGETPSPHRAGG